MTFYDIYTSPLGDITISTNGEAITGLHLPGDRYFSLPPTGVYQPGSQLLLQLRSELDEYFAAKRTTFTIPIMLNGTPFQQAVWQAMQDIAYGKVTSYSKIAAAINKPKAVRAVGSAIGRNPLCIILPCHRVLASNGELGGYVAGVEHKQWLLNHEKTTNHMIL